MDIVEGKNHAGARSDPRQPGIAEDLKAENSSSHHQSSPPKICRGMFLRKRKG